VEVLWERTQTPKQHERWDLRFTAIEYLPRADESEPQRFRYATRIGLGRWIEGGGETTGETDAPDGKRSSALRFWSEEPWSLIEEGSGYWKYVPAEGGVDFITGYDYRVRWGRVGRLLDRVFRPVMGWATAWSFDRLRLWVERGTDPGSAAQAALAYTTLRLAVVAVWLYHGIAPKLVTRDADELAMLDDAGFDEAAASAFLTGLGWAEVAFAAVTVVCWMQRWPLWLTAAAMPLALAGVAVNSPRYLTQAFNPASLNVLMLACAAAALLLWPMVPSARRCRRRPDRSAAKP